MKLVTCIVRPERLHAVKEALFQVGVTGMTLSRVSGHGGEQEVVEFAKQFGLEAQASGPRDLAELLKRDSAEWGGLVKQTGFTAES